MQASTHQEPTKTGRRKTSRRTLRPSDSEIAEQLASGREKLKSAEQIRQEEEEIEEEEDKRRAEERPKKVKPLKKFQGCCFSFNIVAKLLCPLPLKSTSHPGASRAFQRLARKGTREGSTFLLRVFSRPHDPLRQPPRIPRSAWIRGNIEVACLARLQLDFLESLVQCPLNKFTLSLGNGTIVEVKLANFVSSLASLIKLSICFLSERILFLTKEAVQKKVQIWRLQKNKAEKPDQCCSTGCHGNLQ